MFIPFLISYFLCIQLEQHFPFYSSLLLGSYKACFVRFPSFFDVFLSIKLQLFFVILCSIMFTGLFFLFLLFTNMLFFFIKKIVILNSFRILIFFSPSWIFHLIQIWKSGQKMISNSSRCLSFTSPPKFLLLAQSQALLLHCRKVMGLNPSFVQDYTAPNCNHSVHLLKFVA